MPSSQKKYFLVPFLSLFFLVICLFIIPCRVIEQGYLPSDDALRHSAKVISGKNWNEILVISDKFKLDSHPGWHDILGLVHKSTGADQTGLVFFSVAILFFIFCFIPVFFLEFPEAWILALFGLSLVNDNFIMRLFLGRPYLFTMSVLLVLCFLWPKFKQARVSYGAFSLLAGLIALSTWIHGSPYLFILPIACFFLAGERLAGTRISIATGIGVLLGAAFTGHPILFFKQTILQALFVFGTYTPKRSLVFEFQPFSGDILTVMLAGSILLWSYVSGKWNSSKVKNPLFILACGGWFLGFLSSRLWLDWGMPALCAWMAIELQGVLKKIFNRSSLQRLIAVIILTLSVYAAFTNDFSCHWRNPSPVTFLDYNNPKHKALLPAPGGIIYSDNMRVFYDTFYNNPHAPWRYILGFEASWMPEEDLKIFRGIQRSSYSNSSYVPWVKKMNPADRLIIKREKFDPPEIPGLEWNYLPDKIWIGRLR